MMTTAKLLLCAIGASAALALTACENRSGTNPPPPPPSSTSGTGTTGGTTTPP